MNKNHMIHIFKNNISKDIISNKGITSKDDMLEIMSKAYWNLRYN